MLTELSERVRSLRESHGWSQEELGRRAGVTGVHICTIEKGSRNPSLEVLGRIAVALEVPTCELLREAGHAG